MNVTNPAVPRSFPLASVAALRRLRPLVLLYTFVLALLPPSTRAAEAGTLTGSVSNTATGNLLEGAKIELPQLGLTALADNTGRYVLAGVPPGTHEVIASYIGLDPLRQQVTIAPGERTIRNFDLTTGIYQLQEYRVTGEREGDAAAITAQRNAINAKNIVATDSFGYLPNMSVGEVAVFLPGVAGNLAEEGHVSTLSVRGMGPGLNSVTVDGAILSSQGGMSRATRVHVITGAMFDQLELIKGHTPDKGAEGLGGAVNFKSRSPLSMKEKRRVTYSFSARIAPSFTQQIPLREAHRAHPLFNLGYQEVFGLLGGERNLGVAVNLFYSENAVGMFRTTRDFQNTTATPAYLWDYRTLDNYNNRGQQSANVKLDYRLSPTTKLTFNTILNDANERMRRSYETRAFTNQSVGTTGTAGVLPGYTSRITQVRATPGSTIDLTMNGPNNFFNRLRYFDLGAEHELDRWQIDYNAGYNRTKINSGNGRGAALINRITNVGWILDRTPSDLFPRFTQTEGPDITNPANYRPAPNGLAHAKAVATDEVRDVRANARYKLLTEFSVFIKAGARWRQQQDANTTLSRRWNYIGTTALAPDPSLYMLDERKTGRHIPQWQSSDFMRDLNPTTPGVWSEDVYFREQTNFTGTRAVTETVTAGYVMAQGKLGRAGLLGRTGFLTGVRTEKTDTESWGWVRARVASSNALRLADPVGAAQRDYAANRRELEGSYTRSFPSAHLTHDLTSNLKGRVSWSTSYGRPAMTNLLPNESINETNQTLSINNPSLLPQTATNWDATLDYFFEPVGNLSVGWFQKTITDYIVSGVNSGTIGGGADNGYNGEYEGFTRLMSSNAGTAKVQGWELSYQQQFTFLPGFLKGLSGFVNYTGLDTHGDFGGRTNLSTGQIAGFVPRTANGGLSWRHRGFSSRVLVNHTGGYIDSYSAASPGRNLYRFKRTVVNVGFAYQLRPTLQLTCDVSNLFNEPQAFYRGIPDQMQSTIILGTTINVGVAGRF
ncbi:MAG: TonB-dependent receptor [Verrucomicrobia bacterium]|nr:TonB-dependent receptor [Verrucomicrobiota bacterium]